MWFSLQLTLLAVNWIYIFFIFSAAVRKLFFLISQWISIGYTGFVWHNGGNRHKHIFATLAIWYFSVKSLIGKTAEVAEFKS